jgi:hypothetical protein
LDDEDDESSEGNEDDERKGSHAKEAATRKKSKASTKATNRKSKTSFESVPEEKTRTLPSRRAKTVVSSYKETDVTEGEINKWDESAGTVDLTRKRKSGEDWSSIAGSAVKVATPSAFGGLNEVPFSSRKPVPKYNIADVDHTAEDDEELLSDFEGSMDKMVKNSSSILIEGSQEAISDSSQGFLASSSLFEASRPKEKPSRNSNLPVRKRKTVL